MANSSIGVYLAPRQLEEVSAIAAESRVSRSRLISMAVAVGLPLIKAGHGADPTRIIGHLEYIQAAIDLLMERSYPDLHEQLPGITMARMVEHHG